MTTQVLLPKDVDVETLASDPRWEVFLLRVDELVYQRIHEFLFQTDRPGVTTVHTSMMLCQPRVGMEGRFIMCFRDSPRVAMEFKLAFECQHFPQGEMPTNYHFDLQVDPATPVQTLALDPLKAQGLY